MITQEPIMENAVWSPPHAGGRRPSASTLLLRQMAVGQVKRIYHPDLRCEGTGESCTLVSAVTRVRKKGWRCETYHEGPHILVVRRLA